MPSAGSPPGISSRGGAPSTLARSAGVAGAATLASRLLGVAREALLAAYFGAGDHMDAFYVAFRIPNLVRDLFAEGAMSAAFVPTFTRRLSASGREPAWRLANQAITALIAVTLVLVAAGFVFAPQIVAAYAGGYADVPGKLELTIRLARIVLPFLVLVAVATVLMGVLNSFNHYFVPSLSPAMFNLGTIACVVALTPLMPRFGWPGVTAVAIGALVGGAGQVALQWPVARAQGFRYRPALNLRDSDLRQVLLLMGPGVLGLAATQVNIFVATLFATGEGTGAVSWLNYAFRLIYLPIGLFGVSIATATLPTVSRQAARANRDGVRETVSHALRLMLTLNLPASVGLFVLATPIVRLLFEHGQFQPSDTTATATALRLYTVGLIGYSTARIASPVFYALGRSRVPVLVSVASVVTNLAASLTLVGAWGFRALAFATSLAALVNGATLVLLLRGELRGLDGRRLALAAGKIAAATLVMAAVAAGADGLLPRVLSGAGTGTQGVRLAITIGLSIATLAAAARILRLEEFENAIAAVGITRR